MRSRVLALGSAAVCVACGGSDLVLPSETEPAALALVDGGDQTGPVGAELARPIVLRATDSRGQPATGARIAFLLGAGAAGGRVEPDTALTDADGRAAVRWTLGGAPGTQALEARVVGREDVRLAVSAVAAEPSAAALAMEQQPSSSAISGARLERQPSVRLRDAGGAPIRQAGVAITAAAPQGTTLTGQLTQPTDAGGLATFTDLALAGPAGSYALSFSSAGLVPVTSSAIALVPPGPSASRSTITADPSTIAAVTGASTITVIVLDAAGNPFPGAKVVPSASGQSAQFDPTTAPTGPDGTARFTFRASVAATYTIGAAAGGTRLDASATVVVSKATTRTTVTGVAPNPTAALSPVVVGYAVQGTGGAPTGSVTVSDGDASCTAGVTQGQCQLTPRLAGDRTLTVSYSGDDRFAPSEATAPLRVNPLPVVVTTPTIQPGPVVTVGAPVTLSSRVTASAGTPTGTVTFARDGCSGTPLGPAVALGDGGVARLGTSFSSAGAVVVVACYSGDRTFLSATSTGLTVLVFPS